MDEDSSSWKAIHPVLRLSWEQLFSEEHPWLCNIEPIPRTSPSWKRYLESFFLPTLENFRSCLERKLSEFSAFEITFRSFSVRSKLEESSFLLDDPTGSIYPGDVCLISSDNPSSKEIGVSSEVWDGCGWMLANHRDKENAALVRCQVFSFDCKTDIVYAATIDSASTTYRILKSLDYQASRRWKDLFDEELLNKDLKQLILTGCAPVRPVVSMATVDQRMHGALSTLNESQLLAVHACLEAVSRPGSIELIQGPPGTGKTTCIVVLLLALLFQSKRVLQVAPTNIAVLDLAKKLISHESFSDFHPDRIVVVVNERRENIKRLIDDQLAEFVLSLRVHRLLTKAKKMIESLIALVDFVSDERDRNPECDEQHLFLKYCESVLEVVAIWNDEFSISLFETLSSIVKKIRCAAIQQNHFVVSARIRELQLLSVKNFSQNALGDFNPRLVSQLEKSFVDRASIIFCTLSGSKSTLIIPVQFEVAVVDECAQAIEAEMVGLIKSSLQSLILVGDPKQLHGTVFSHLCLEAAYQRSLFERLASSNPVHLLAVQYRMHPSISAFSNEAFYNGRIENSSLVQSYNPIWYSDLFPPLHFIGHKMTFCKSNDHGSWYNEEESLLIALQLGSFLQSFPKLNLHIGVISPYTAQKRVLEQRVINLKDQIDFCANIKVSTVDGFQGQECDIIIFSLTRTGTSTSFLEQWNRMNVAVTRAKYALWVFGDCKLFLRDDRTRIWCRFAVHCKSTGALGCFDSEKFYADPEVRALAQRVVVAIKKQQPLQPSNTMKKRSFRTKIDCRDHHIWRLIASESVMHEFSRCENSTARGYILIFSRLLMGDFSEARRPYRKECGSLGKLFIISKVADQLVLLWTIEIRLGSQVIYAIRSLKKSQLASAWNSFKIRRQGYSPEYLAACVTKLVSNAVPRTGLKDVSKHFWGGTGADDAFAGSIKLFDLSDGPLIEMFSSASDALRANFAVPYILDETQDEAVHYSKGSVILVGRGGCGKTSVLAQRILNRYKSAIMQEVAIPRQLFISVSPMLVENVKTEFGRLVNTFHSEYEQQFDRPEHSGCTFLSVQDLIFQIDSQIEPQQRIFYEKGCSRRLIVKEGDDEEEQTNRHLPRRELYTENDVIDFDRFRRLYFPHFSDQVRKIFAPEFVFTEIMFTIKGGNRTDFVHALTLKEYLQVSECSSALVNVPESQRKLLYESYKTYENSRVKWHHIDYPEIIASIISRRNNSLIPVDSIYVDEVQDLMPCHWRLLDMFRHPETQFVCCGDQAQCITAGNRFRFSKLKSFLFESSERKEVKPLQIDLTVNYRTIQEVLVLANRILDVIRFFFPDEIDRIQGERSARPPPDMWTGTPRLFKENPHEALSFLFAETKELAAEQIIIVREFSQKDELLASLASAGWQANVLTILEAKGLEFEDVVLYDMFSSSGVGSQRLRVLMNFVACDTVQEFDIRKHYELCHFLKELYVGVTRCKHRLLFIDSGKDECQIYLDVFKGLIQLTTTDKEMSFNRSSTIEDWACKALQYEGAGLLREARNAFLKAEQMDNVTRLEAEILITEFEKSRDPELIIQAAELLVKINRVEQAANRLYDAKQFSHAAELYRKLVPVREQEIVVCYMLAGLYEQSCEALFEFEKNLDAVIFIKLVLKLVRTLTSLSNSTSSHFKLVIALVLSFPSQQSAQIETACKWLQNFIVHWFEKSSFDPHVFPTSGTSANLVTAFISVLARFNWIDEGIIFFQTRLKSNWKAAVCTLLRTAHHLTEPQELVLRTHLSELILWKVPQIPFDKDIPKICEKSTSSIKLPAPATAQPHTSKGPRNSVKTQRDLRKAKERARASGHSQKMKYVPKVPVPPPQPTLSILNCRKFLEDRIKQVLMSMNGFLDDDIASDLLSVHSDKTVSNSLSSFLYAGISILSLAILSKSILELGLNNVQCCCNKILQDTWNLTNIQCLKSTPLLFEAAARCFLKESQLREVAAFIFRSLGNAIEAIACFECKGFERQLLNELKLSTPGLGSATLQSKYSKLAISFAEKNDYGPALFCMSKITEIHSVHVKQTIFQMWLDKRRAADRAPDWCSAFEFNRRFDQETGNLMDDILCLPKKDVSKIKHCYDDLSSSRANLKQSEYGWFVERIIIWVLRGISPEKLNDVSVLSQNLSYIVRLRIGINIEIPSKFCFFMNSFILARHLVTMMDIPFKIIFSLIKHLFACSVAYLFHRISIRFAPYVSRFEIEIRDYVNKELIEERASEVLIHTVDMIFWLRNRNRTDMEQFEIVVQHLLKEWDDLIIDPRNAAIIEAIRFEKEGSLSGLKRAAGKYKQFRMKAMQARIGKKIDLLRVEAEQKLQNQDSENSTLRFARNKEDAATLDPHSINNEPVISTTSSAWSEPKPSLCLDSKTLPLNSYQLRILAPSKGADILPTNSDKVAEAS